MKKPVIGIYGKSDTGKTTLIIDIIKQLSDEGFKIATIKITDKKIGIDTKGKDTWKHGEAGARLVVLSSPKGTNFLLKRSEDILEIIDIIYTLGEYDLVIIEGANDKYTPKIRIGDIEKRENTIFTYTDDFFEIIELLKTKFIGGKNANNS
jgi:molybdopterin-guanine dinucleotide biosynthesis protein B